MERALRDGPVRPVRRYALSPLFPLLLLYHPTCAVTVSPCGLDSPLPLSPLPLSLRYRALSLRYRPLSALSSVLSKTVLLPD